MKSAWFSSAYVPRHSGIVHDNLDVLALIPARGGSVGLPRKNIIDLNGKPLLAYSIEAALKCRANTRVVVSTDDEEIAEVAVAYGAEVPFLRPTELAGSEANLGQAMGYTVQKLRDSGYHPHIVLHFLPTSPFRNTRLVNTMLDKLVDGHQSVETVKTFHLDRQQFYMPDGDSLAIRNTRVHAGSANHCFRIYGLLSGYRTKLAPKGNYAHPIDDPTMFIDIDGPEDLLLASTIMANNHFDFDAE